jgi:hypothetical protein
MILATVAGAASLLSSIAVCGSVIYLAIQVRQSDRNQRTMLQQATSARNMEALFRFVEPHHAGMVARVWKGETEFSDVEAIQLDYIVRAMLLGFQDQFLLHRQSLVDSAQIDTLERSIKRIFGVPAFRALWVNSREIYAPVFSSYMEALLADAPIMAPIDFAARIKAVANELRAAETR